MEDEEVWGSNYKSKQGNVGLGQAIAYYMSKGYVVSLPINDTQPYDLIVDKMDGNGLRRVSVKTTQYQCGSGNYTALLENLRRKKNECFCKYFDNSSIDIVFIYTISKEMWEIDAKDITSKKTITLGENMEKYKIQ